MLAADLRFVKNPQDGWRLLRDGKPVQELALSETRTFLFPANWREPVVTARMADAGQLRKQLYIAFLKKRYGYQIAMLNRAYGLDATAFTELESSDFKELDGKRAEVLADDLAFASELYAENVELAFRRVDGKLRLLSVPDGIPDELLRSIGDMREVDGILLRGPVSVPISGIQKPILLLHCPAVKPAFATACARI